MNEPKFLTEEEIIGLADLKTEDVFVPEWDCTIRIKSLTGRERDKWEGEFVAQNARERNLENLRARFVVLTAIKQDGSPQFSNAAKLGAKNAAALSRLFNVAMKLNGMLPDDVSTLTKNSEGVPSGDSTSA